MNGNIVIEWAVPEVTGTEEALQKAFAACMAAEGITLPAYAQLLITTDEEIHELNREYRNVDRPTDVLSFPSTSAHPGYTLGSHQHLLRREMDDTGACFLGDIIISLERAYAQAEEYGHSPQRELTYLTVHALFHLMGYDHMEECDKRSMRAMEEKVMETLGVTRVTDQELIEKAKQAMQFAYVPYSHYKVGAALLSKDGRIFTGCNIENGSYGATNCAERTALFKAVSEGCREFSAIAITAEKSAPWPCGICRQALNEFAPDIRVIVAWQGQVQEAALPQLLPHGFGPGNGTLDYLGKE